MPGPLNADGTVKRRCWIQPKPTPARKAKQRKARQLRIKQKLKWFRSGGDNSIYKTSVTEPQRAGHASGPTDGDRASPGLRTIPVPASSRLVWTDSDTHWSAPGGTARRPQLPQVQEAPASNDPRAERPPTRADPGPRTPRSGSVPPGRPPVEADTGATPEHTSALSSDARARKRQTSPAHSQASEWSDSPTDRGRTSPQDRRRGIELWEVPANGNCLYQAVVDGVEEAMSRLNLVCAQVLTQQQARVRIAEILTRKRTFYKGQWDHLDTHGDRARKWRHYVKEIAAEGTWGGSLELHAAAQAYTCRILVVGSNNRASSGVAAYTWTNGEPAFTIVLEFSGSHYDVLVPAGGSDSAACWSEFLDELEQAAQPGPFHGR